MDRVSRPVPGTTLLAVDDDPDVLFIVAEMLSYGGYDVLTAPDGLDAIDCLQAHPEIRLVLTDIRMPGMDGVQLAEAIGHFWPALPIMLMTGYDGGHLTAAGLAFLRKPFRGRELLLAIGAALAA